MFACIIQGTFQSHFVDRSSRAGGGVIGYEYEYEYDVYIYAAAAVICVLWLGNGIGDW